MRMDETGAAEALLWQMGDDQLLVGFRAGEWLGLAPHFEADLAYASVGQDALGHATYVFQILEDRGFGKRDDLALLRPVEQRCNSVLLEWPNGPGSYLADPQFDWAFTMVRQYLYDCWETIRLGDLTQSRDNQLAEAARAMLSEKAYHRLHQEVWLEHMAADAKGREHLAHGMRQAFGLVGDLAETGTWTPIWAASRIWPEVDTAPRRWLGLVAEGFAKTGMVLPAMAKPYDGRLGIHSPHLQSALATMSEVYRVDPTAQW